MLVQLRKNGKTFYHSSETVDVISNMSLPSTWIITELKFL